MDLQYCTNCEQMVATIDGQLLFSHRNKYCEKRKLPKGQQVLN